MAHAFGRRAERTCAAYFAGIGVTRVVAATFLISSLLAALDGLLLRAYVGGAFLEMGGPYLLQSLGAVVLGGSLIMGGSSTALGTLVRLRAAHPHRGHHADRRVASGMQDIVQGVVVIAVLSLAGGGGGGR